MTELDTESRHPDFQVSVFLGPVVKAQVVKLNGP